MAAPYAPLAGDFRYRATLQGYAATRSVAGQQQKTWADVGTYWAAIKSVRGREEAVAGQVRAEWIYLVTLKKNSVRTPTPQDRLVINGRPHNIDSVDDLDTFNERIISLVCRAILTPA